MGERDQVENADWSLVSMKVKTLGVDNMGVSFEFFMSLQARFSIVQCDQQNPAKTTCFDTGLRMIFRC